MVSCWHDRVLQGGGAPVVQGGESLGAWYDRCGRNGITHTHVMVVATTLTPALGLQGVDIPDVLTVVQWRVPKDLNTLMQRFGRAGRDFSLQAVAILLAEPKWFLEDHQKRLTRKRKRIQKGKQKASRPRPRADTGARTSNVCSSDDGSDSEGETSINTGKK